MSTGPGTMFVPEMVSLFRLQILIAFQVFTPVYSTSAATREYKKGKESE